MTNKDTRYGPAELYDMIPLVCEYYLAMQKRIGQILAGILASQGINKPRVIEIGTGSGLTTQAVISAIPDIRIVSLDNDPEMTKVAKRKICRKRSIRLVTEDALGFLEKLNSEGVHALVSGCTLHNLEHDYQLRVLEEAARVIALDGAIVIGDKIAVEDEASHRRQFDIEMEKLSEFEKRGLPDLTKLWRKHYLEDDEHRVTEYQFANMLTASGFTDVRYLQRFGLDVIVTATKA